MMQQSNPEKKYTDPGIGQYHSGLIILALGFTVLGILLSIMGLVASGNIERFGFSWLWGGVFVWTIILGCLFFVALQHVTRSRWSVVIRRAAEVWAGPMWLVGLFFIPVILFCVNRNVFPWRDDEIFSHLHPGKQAYYNLPFFIARTTLYFILWIGFARFFVQRSIKQDRTSSDVTSKMVKLSGPFLLLFAFTATFASFDWLMSLDIHWFSTIYGVYMFSGMTVTALAVITLTTLWLDRLGRLGDKLIRDDHIYNLGCLMFAFTSFWAYIAFSQYMLIWYGNIPEETVYFIRRLDTPWLSVSIALAVVRFFVPFFLLLGRWAKMHRPVLVIASVVIILGQLLDIYWLIMPQLSPDGPQWQWLDLGPVLLMSGIILLYIGWFISKYSCLANNDPLFEASSKFHL